MDRQQTARLQQFLDRFKRDLKAGRVWILRRPVNMRCLAALGLTLSLALESLEELQAEQWYRGPERDDKNRPCAIWIFGPIIRDTQVYVKISEPDDADQPTLVISFHEPEFPLKKRQR